MSGWLRPRNIAIVGGIGAAIFLFPRTAKKAQVPNPFETPAVKSIGDRYSAGGGTNTHAPGVATTRGDSTKNISPQEKEKGAGTPHFNENLADQRAEEPGAVTKAFHQAHYGNDKGK